MTAYKILLHLCLCTARERESPMLPQACILVFNQRRVGVLLCVILERVSQEVEGPQRLLPPFKDEHLEWAQTSRVASLPQGEAPTFPHGWLKMSEVHPYTPIMIRLGHSGRVHQKVKC